MENTSTYRDEAEQTARRFLQIIHDGPLPDQYVSCLTQMICNAWEQGVLAGMHRTMEMFEKAMSKHYEQPDPVRKETPSSGRPS